MKTPLLWVMAVGFSVAASLAACSSDEGGSKASSGGSGGATGGSGGQSGSGGSTGGSGGATGGSAGTGGSADTCAADETNAVSTLGCNGSMIGAQADNAYGGKCTPDENDPQGSCSDSSLVCDYYDATLVGICVQECTPGATYVSTGGCPSGSRCFDFGTVAYCYPDCSSGTDCGTGVCDEDGACSSEIPPDTDGGTDAGASDASTD